jgi:hypothetical protein
MELARVGVEDEGIGSNSAEKEGEEHVYNIKTEDG